MRNHPLQNLHAYNGGCQIIDHCTWVLIVRVGMGLQIRPCFQVEQQKRFSIEYSARVASCWSHVEHLQPCKYANNGTPCHHACKVEFVLSFTMLFSKWLRKKARKQIKGIKRSALHTKIACFTLKITCLGPNGKIM